MGGPTLLLLLSGPPAAPAALPSLKRALAAHLTAQAGLSALLAQPAEPVHPAEDSGYTALTFRVASRAPGAALSGDAGFADASVEFAARSTRYGDAEAVVAALSALYHARWNYSLAGLPVMTSVAAEDDDDYADAGDGEDDGTFADSITINFRYRTR